MYPGQLTRADDMAEVAAARRATRPPRAGTNEGVNPAARAGSARKATAMREIMIRLERGWPDCFTSSGF